MDYRRADSCRHNPFPQNGLQTAPNEMNGLQMAPRNLILMNGLQNDLKKGGGGGGHALQLEAVGSPITATGGGVATRRGCFACSAAKKRNTSGSFATMYQASRTSWMQAIASFSRSAEASREPSMHNAKMAA